MFAGMAGFAGAVKGTGVRNQWNEGNKAAWSRDDKGFIFITNEGSFQGSLQTGLPSGDYCNVIQGCPTNSGCEGDTVHVDGGGNAQITVSDGMNPMVAIHVSK